MKIKQLEWFEFKGGYCESKRFFDTFYTIAPLGGYYESYINTGDADNNKLLGTYYTVADAKSHAQRHFEESILYWIQT